MQDQSEQIGKLAPDDIASWDYAQIWDKFPVPARPAKEELAFLEKEIKTIPHESVLILGSTIEYRSLCKKLGIAPYIADFERSHYEILTSYAKEDFGNERFLEVDWLDLKDENKYEVIIGHRAINVIGKDVLERFFKRMHHALKPGGVFYCKGNVLYRDTQERFDERVDEWAFKKDREYPLFSYIEVDLYFHTADEDGYVIYPKARAVVEQLLKDKRCTQEDYKLIKLLVSMSEEARFRGLIHEQEIKDAIGAARYSKQEWIVKDKDICANMPIIKLRK